MGYRSPMCSLWQNDKTSWWPAVCLRIDSRWSHRGRRPRPPYPKSRPTDLHCCCSDRHSTSDWIWKTFRTHCTPLDFAFADTERRSNGTGRLARPFWLTVTRRRAEISSNWTFSEVEVSPGLPGQLWADLRCSSRTGRWKVERNGVSSPKVDFRNLLIFVGGEL